MTENEFDVLAARALAGEATAEESSRLEKALAQSPELRREFDDLRATWTTLKEAGPLANAMSVPPMAPPAKRLKEWERAVVNQSGPVVDGEQTSRRPKEVWKGAIVAWLRRNAALARWSVAAVCIALVTVVALLLSLRRAANAPSTPIAYVVDAAGQVDLRRDGKVATLKMGTALRETDEIRLSSEASAVVITATETHSLRGPGTFAAAKLLVGANSDDTNAAARLVRTALFRPPQEMLGLLVTTRSTASIPIYSPVGFTTDLTPLLLWKTQSGKIYDVIISDEFSPATAPFRQRGVTSPLEFTNAWTGRTLASDGLYRLRITESGNPITASELTFRTLPLANENLVPGDQLLTAYQMLSASPVRFGDALAALLNLPAETAHSETALRLKLLAFGQLGYEEDFTATLRSLEAIK